MLGGFKAQGRTAESAEMVIKDTLAVQEAGAKLILVKGIPPEFTGDLTQILNIPVLGIGAGMADGQLLISGDMLGYFEVFYP